MIGLLDPSEAILDYVSYENTLARFKCFSLQMIEISGLTTGFWPYIRLNLE